MSSPRGFPGYIPGLFICTPTRTLTQQLQAVLGSRDVSLIQKVTEVELRVVQQDIVPNVDKRPAPTFAQVVLGASVQADALLRCYLACLDPHRIINPWRTTDFLIAKTAKVAVKEVYRCINYLQSGIRMSRASGHLSQLRTLTVPLKTQGGGPEAPGGAARASTPRTVDLTPQTIELNKSCIPDLITADMFKTYVSPEFVQVVFDYMIQRLVEDCNYSLAEFPVHPHDRPMALTCTQDVEHLPLPMVRAELPNPWIRNDFHRQVLSILTFYKMWQVHADVLRDMEEWGWPRDLNARGFTVFYPQARGTELLFKECGVRVHSSDRECSQAQLRTMAPKDVALLFGEPEDRGTTLQSTLSEREKRQVLEILHFPFTLISAFLSACKGGAARNPSPRPLSKAHTLSFSDWRDGRTGRRGSIPHSAPLEDRKPPSPQGTQSRFGAKITRFKEIVKVAIVPQSEKTSAATRYNSGLCSPPKDVGAFDNPLTGTALGNLYLAMASESCVNLRFFALMEEVRSILNLKTVGQVVLGAAEELMRRDPALENASLDRMTSATLASLKHHGQLHGWDEKEARNRAIDAGDVRVHLRHLGYE